MGCPSSPPVPPGSGCVADTVVVVPSFPQFDVFELEGFEINPNNIKRNCNMILKI